MKIEITPGPWEVAPVFHREADCWIVNYYGDDFDQMEIDAKAISAVPEMLRVIVEIKEYSECGDHLPDYMRELLDNALRKAGVME